MSVRARVERDGSYWVAEVIDGGGFTQARRLDRIPGYVVEVVKLMTGATTSPEDVNLEIVIPGVADIDDIAALRSEVAALQGKLAARTRETARLLHKKGFTLRDIGVITGLSHQRVDQLIH